MCGTVDSLVDTWHDVSAPVVDNPVISTALSVIPNPVQPFMLAYKGTRALERGDTANALLNFAGSWGSAGGFDGSSFGADTGLDLPPGASSELSGLPADTGLELPPGAMPEIGRNVASDLPGSFSQANAGASSAYNPMAANFEQAPLGSGVSGAQAPVSGTDFVSSGGMNPLPTVGQGGELAYNPADIQTPGGFGLSDALNFAGGKIPGLGITPMQGLSGLYDMSAKNKIAEAQMSRFNKINSDIDNMYAPGTPEHEAMRQMLARQDAKAGRNSQYGQRAVDLAARIALIKAQQRQGMATSQNALMNQGLQNQTSGLNSLFGYINKNQAQQTLADMMGNR